MTTDRSAIDNRSAKLTALALMTFGNQDKANRWLNKPHHALKGQSPDEAMQDENGADIVENLLLNIDEGTY